MADGIRHPVTKTTCPYCGTGCGVDAQVDAADNVRVAGDLDHPTNRGRLCVKGSALAETVVPHGRLLHPQLRHRQEPGQPLRRVAWSEALDLVADRFRRTIEEHGADSVAWYVSGQLLTEDYYVANKLVKGFVGTANIDTNSRLCMSSAVAGHKRAFGEDIVPVAYDDFERTDLVVLVGSNTAWCHPILFQRLLRAREQRPGMKIVVVDPRATATTEMADLHLPLRAGSDVALFNGLLHYLQRNGHADRRFIDGHTSGLDAALSAAGDATPEAVAETCGLPPDDLNRFFELFATRERVITCFSMGVNQASAGTDKVNAIINCHLLTGRLGREGMGPFSLTGQPNAMGGREVGGLANMLAAHMDLERDDHRDRVRRFWNSPTIASKPGLKAVDLFDAIDSGKVKAVWIMATNPVVSLPNADRVKRALERCEFVVVSDVMEATDTTAYADVLLPAHGWGEKNGTVTNSERCISRQRPFVTPLGEARSDWWALSEIARRWGYQEQFPYQSVHEIFDEHARLSAFENDGSRYFDIGGLSGLDSHDYDALTPLRWPVIAGQPRDQHGMEVFADGRYYHADGRARFVATAFREPGNRVGGEYPLVLNTGRVRDHWHTMTRTGLSARLSSHIAEPFAELHEDDAGPLGITDGGLVRVSTRWGSLVARARVSGEHKRGSVFVPIHWNAQFSSDARVGALVNPEVDPISGEPEFKHTPARVSAFVPAWHGFILSRKPLSIHHLAWWTRVTGDSFVRYELAGDAGDMPSTALARKLLGANERDPDWLEYSDEAAGRYRAAFVVDNRLEAMLFVSPQPDLPSRNWLSSLFSAANVDDTVRIGLLAGEAPELGADQGATVCSCYGVGVNRIVSCIEAGQANSVETLGQVLKCGTNCGSCVPELRKILSRTRTVTAG
jgi:assimilatory nitrate reductase catalytic subunit